MIASCCGASCEGHEVLQGGNQGVAEVIRADTTPGTTPVHPRQVARQGASCGIVLRAGGR